MSSGAELWVVPTDLHDSDYDALESVRKREMNLRSGTLAVQRLVGVTVGLLSGVGAAGVGWGMPAQLENAEAQPPIQQTQNALADGSSSSPSSSPSSSSVPPVELPSAAFVAVPMQPPATSANTAPDAAQIDLTSSTQATDLLKPDLLKPTESSPAIAQLDPLEPEVEQEQNAEKSEELRVPAGQGETITEIQLQYVDRDGQPVEGRTQPEIIIREFELQPGDTYDPVLAKEGLARVVSLAAIRDASIRLEPATDPTQAIMVVVLRESGPIAFYPGNQVTRPSVLRGITTPEPVPVVPLRLNGIQLPGSIQWRNIAGLDQSLTFGALFGDQADGFDLTFANPWIAGTNHFGYALNFQGIGYLNPTFNSGDEVELPDGNTDFWERRVGGGIQIVQNPMPELGWAAGLSYQQVSMREALTGSRLFTKDAEGNRLVLSDDGIDSLLTFNATLDYDNLNNPLFPTQGSHFQLGIDQSIPVGDASILYTRPTANFTQFLPLSFITVDGTPSTLLFNLQGGTLLGDTPPYEAFVLGGSSSVRGYGAGALGNPQTYLQTSLEYRAPFAMLRIKQPLLQEALGDRVLFAANVFADYATGFGTQTFVTGEPGVVRGKPGAGFGFGLGLLATSKVGLVRLEAGLSDQGDFALIFTIGDRF